MSKLFIYSVNGSTFEDTEAFGQAWRDAKAMATAEHTCITRQVVCGDTIRNEFYAKGGCFLNERFDEVDKVAVF